MSDIDRATIHAYTKAVIHLLLGNRRIGRGVAVVAGGPLDMETRVGLARTAGVSDTDVVFLEFDTNADGEFGITGVNVLVPRGGACYLQTGCQFWLGETGNRAVILPNLGSRGHFRLAPREIIHVDGKPADDPSAGIARAAAWLKRRVASGAPAPNGAEVYDLPQAA